MARTPRSFRRDRAFYDEQPTYLVLCEDTKSSLIYLADAAQHFRVQAKVQVANCGRTDPQGIVAEALSRKKEFGKVFCVIDRDGHQKFDEAIRLCKDEADVKVIASYPCYEYWIFLHFKGNRKPYVATPKDSSADLLLKDLSKEEGMENYSKGKSVGLFQTLKDRLPTARKNAALIVEAAKGDGQFNPSTLIHELIDAFEELGQLKPAI